MYKGKATDVTDPTKLKRNTTFLFGNIHDVEDLRGVLCGDMYNNNNIHDDDEPLCEGMHCVNCPLGKMNFDEFLDRLVALRLKDKIEKL